MLSLPETALAALEDGRIVHRMGIVFDFPSGTYAYWTGAGPFTWNGVVFAPGGGLIEVSEIADVSDMTSVPVTLKLRAIPDAGLDADALGSIEAESYHQRPVTIYAFLFSADDGSFLVGIRHYAGYIDQISHADDNGDYHLEASLESRARDHGKTGYRMRTVADQDRVSPGDLIFQHVATVATVARKWGRA